VDDSNLSGLDFAAARELVLAYAIDIKRYDRDIAAAAGELELWSSRERLALEKGMADLAAAAAAKAEGVRSALAALSGERDELKAKVEIMRRQLPSIRASERSVDPDRLLAELQLMTGELLGDQAADGAASGTGREIAELEAGAAADAALSELKKKMGRGGPEPKPGTDGVERG